MKMPPKTHAPRTSACSCASAAAPIGPAAACFENDANRGYEKLTAHQILATAYCATEHETLLEMEPEAFLSKWEALAEARSLRPPETGAAADNATATARANLGIFRYRARAHESAAPRHATFMSGEQLLLLGSPQDHRLYNPDAQPLVFVELGCPLDGDVPASAAVFRRRRYIPQTPLVAAPAPCIPSRPPRNHYHETGEITRRDGELASGWCIIIPASSFLFFLRN